MVIDMKYVERLSHGDGGIVKPQSDDLGICDVGVFELLPAHLPFASHIIVTKISGCSVSIRY